MARETELARARDALASSNMPWAQIQMASMRAADREPLSSVALLAEKARKAGGILLGEKTLERQSSSEIRRGWTAQAEKEMAALD